MIPIPAIDLKGGVCVRLLKGDMQKETVYGRDPVAMARKRAKEGARRLHLVDLDGAVDGTPAHLAVIRDIARAVDIPLEVGGGIRTLETMKTYRDMGIESVIVGTSAFSDPGFLDRAGDLFPGRFSVALDTRGDKIAVRGWLSTAAEDMAAWFSRLNACPLFAIIHTDVSRDGTRQGPNVTALKTVLEKSVHPVIASGGVGALTDLTVLKETESRAGKDFFGVIIGRALYENAFTLRDAAAILED
jgi:phosphoribosylformimino-5-aminoimidazole carboxamide ribotide isomerase